MLKTKKLVKNNKITAFRPQIKSRHPSHSILRNSLPKLPVRSVVRLGSLTEFEDVAKGTRIEINSVQAIKNSSNKLLMKQCFSKADVRTADWWTIYKGGDEFKGVLLTCKNNNEEPLNTFKDLPFPIVAKHIYGSRGEGNFKLDNQQQLEQWLRGKTLTNYIFEKYYNYSREYRLHVNKNGCFYTCRKMLKEDTPADKRWFRNDSNSVWVVEGNPQFDKPVNWNTIVGECVKALNAVGLDFSAFDVKIQSSKTEKGKIRENPEFIIIESNSAPSFGDITAQKYIDVLPQMIIDKYNSTIRK